MPRVTQAHVDARRREILEAAHRCIARDGFQGATMQRIADEADLSAGALYQYFDGKYALIRALADRGRSQKKAALESVEPSSGIDGLEGLVASMVASLPPSEDDDHAVRFDVRLWGEALGEPELQRMVTDGLEDFRELIRRYLEAGQRAGRIRSDVEPDVVARVVVSLLTGLELQLAFEDGLDRSAYVEAVGRLFTSLEAPGD